MTEAAKTRARAKAVMLACTSSLSHHGPRALRPKAMLEELCAAVSEDEVVDSYGEGPALAAFEADVAARLGMEAAVFMPSGTMAQQIALRIASEHRGLRHVAFHPRCHVEVHEEHGYQLLHGLHAALVGQPDRPMKLEDLGRVKDPLAALLIELPQRDLGGVLPSWDELVGLVGAARTRGAHVHLDGARLWESAAFYGKAYPEIAGLFDSAYVSFYKALGAVAGAALAGTGDFVAEARVWQRRHGGTLSAIWPYALSARLALETRLPRIPRYIEKARGVAAALAGVRRVRVTPFPPHTNMMHVYLIGDRRRIEAAAVDVAEASGVWLFGKLQGTRVPATSLLEVSIGDGALDVPDERFAALLGDVLARAAEPGA